MKDLPLDHPLAFDGIELKPSIEKYGLTKMCKLCAGHGSVVTEPHAYGQGVHFKRHCSHCNGWGWLKPTACDDNHEWVHKRKVGRCCDDYECSKCGAERTIDSSD